YDWSIVQPGSSLAGIGGPARVAICVEVDDNASLDVFRVQHDAWSQNTILPLSDPLLECPNPLPGVALATPVTDRLIRLLAPQPLHAAALGKTGSPTGSAGSFSPFEGVNPADVKISFFSEPRDSKKNQTFKGAKGLVQVKVTGQQNTAWQGVSVLIYGVNNNGEKVQFSNDTEETGADGIAIFDQLSTNKTGAYKLWAKTIPTSPGSVSFAQDSVLSNKFNVRP
ncbi:MAG TPA: hypothetical protein VEB59_14010, partial [Gemmatimonadales bacterium]|nr:hypothetical protein [Gemmatimonadales bacterium]